MNYKQQIETVLNNEVQHVAILSSYPLEKIDKLLDSIRQKTSVAFRYQLNEAGELLQIWERQLSDARMIKLLYGIEDNTENEIDMQLPDLSAYEMIEKRQQLLLEKLFVKESIER